jgi:hypothetical protein
MKNTRLLAALGAAVLALGLSIVGAAPANAAAGDSQSNPILIRPGYAFQFCAAEDVPTVGEATGIATQPAAQRLVYEEDGAGNVTLGFSTGKVGGTWYAFAGGTWEDVDGVQRSVVKRTEAQYVCDNVQTIIGPLVQPVKVDQAGTANDTFVIPPVPGAEGRVLTLSSNKIRVQYYALDGFTFAPGTIVAWTYAPFSTR